jgi:hypothetical protein
MGIEMFTEEESIDASTCLNCGAVFGEPVLDHHHGLAAPPAPRPDALTRIWDPEGSRLKSSSDCGARGIASTRQEW